MDNKVLFSISTEMEMEGRDLKSVLPDKDGVYRGIALTCIGIASRNKVDYERESVIRCITNASSRFASNIKSGDMEGEWGHPLIRDNDIARLLHIERSMISHYFTNIYAKNTDSGFVIVYGDVVPFGPYGQYLKASFEDPKRNTSFSLRSASRVRGNKGDIVQKEMLALVTFDAVDGPGFLHASKRFRDNTTAMENLDIAVSQEEYLKAVNTLELMGCESLIKDQQILDAFGCNSVRLRDTVVTKNDKGLYVSEQGPVSIFDTLYKH